MRDMQFVSDNELETTALPAKGSMTVQSINRAPSRSNFWTVVGLCVAGLVFSLFVPASYLNMEQTSTLILQAPLS